MARQAVRSFIITTMMSVLATEAAALEYRPHQTADGYRILVVAGTFDIKERIDAFLSAVSNHAPTVVAFDSPGGSIYSAMELGRAIRKLGLSTFQIRQMECSSACALAFLGGASRYADPGSIGVHRSSFQPGTELNREQAVAGVQTVTADILAYLKEMGVSPDLLSFALRYDATDMRYLSASEMHELHVTATPGTNSPASRQVPALETSDAEQAAAELVRRLVESDSNASLEAVRNWYAAEVSYYGKQTSLSDVLVDKRRYFERWPERYYRIREDTMLVTCGNGHCMVSGIYDWVVRSIARNKQAKGVARFNYTILLHPQPRIISEAGQVIK